MLQTHVKNDVSLPRRSAVRLTDRPDMDVIMLLTHIQFNFIKYY